MGLNFEIIEKGDSIGGTWFWNKYPGVGCDVVSHLYSYSFFKNPNWSKSFSLGDEILRYMVNFWKFAKLQEKTKLQTTVENMEWSENEKKWIVQIKNKNHEKTEKYDWIISCIGALTKPSIANFAEMQKFLGEIVHSAEWTGPKLDGKRIALIGTGASSIQILPRLIKDSKAKRVTLFQRTAPFVFPRGQVEFSENWKSAMSFYPLGVLWRWYEYLIREFLYFAVWKNYTGFFNKLMQQKFEKDLKATIKNKTLAQQLIPDFRLGCKRILFADDYYSSMNDDRFELETDQIEKFTENGIKTSGKNHEFDLIIMATGFKLCESTYTITNDKLLNDRSDTKTFYGTFHPEKPNYATFTGPMTVLGHNSMIFMIECQAQLIINVIRESLSKNASKTVVRSEALESFMSRWANQIDGSVWAPKNCSSWYQQGSKDKRPWSIWPWSTIEFFFRTRENPKKYFAFE